MLGLDSWHHGFGIYRHVVQQLPVQIGWLWVSWLVLALSISLACTWWWLLYSSGTSSRWVSHILRQYWWITQPSWKTRLWLLKTFSHIIHDRWRVRPWFVVLLVLEWLINKIYFLWSLLKQIGFWLRSFYNHAWRRWRHLVVLSQLNGRPTHLKII